MRVCFRNSILGLLAIGALGVSLAAAPARHGKAGVRVDARSGHLLRSVVVLKGIQPVALDKIAVPLPPPDSDIGKLVEEVANKYEVDPLLVHSVIQVESGYNPNAVSPKGAQGLMQLIPATARRFGAINSFDKKENLEAGVKYLKYLNSVFPDNLDLTLAAYNAGEKAVQKYGNTIPPYPETEQYVTNVGKRYGRARRAAEQKKQLAKAAEAPQPSPEEKHPPVESFIDADGRLHLRTKPADMISTP